MEGIIKIFKSLQDSALLSKRVSETVQNEPKKQKGGFPSMLLGTLGALSKWTELEKDFLELVMDIQSKTRLFYTVSSFNQFWNTKVLSK